MPCHHHHHQDTHQQENTHTPPKAQLKCHPNTEKNLANTVLHTHARRPPRRTCGTETETLQGYQHITDTPTHHQTVTDTPPIHHPLTKTRHNQKKTHTAQKHYKRAQICRPYIGTAWAQGDATRTQHGLNIAQREPQVKPT